MVKFLMSRWGLHYCPSSTLIFDEVINFVTTPNYSGPPCQGHTSVSSASTYYWWASETSRSQQRTHSEYTYIPSPRPLSSTHMMDTSSFVNFSIPYYFRFKQTEQMYERRRPKSLLILHNRLLIPIVSSRSSKAISVSSRSSSIL